MSLLEFFYRNRAEIFTLTVEHLWLVGMSMLLAVVIGTTLAFMALTYFLIPVLFRREIMFPTMAKWQPYVFGLGMYGVALFLMAAGTLGVPRDAPGHWRRATRSG